MIRRPPRSTLFPYTTLFRSEQRIFIAKELNSLNSEMQMRPALSLGCLCRSEEHTSELQSQSNLVCRLLLEKKKNDRLRILVRHILLLYYPLRFLSTQIDVLP